MLSYLDWNLRVVLGLLKNCSDWSRFWIESCKAIEWKWKVFKTGLLLFTEPVFRRFLDNVQKKKNVSTIFVFVDVFFAVLINFICVKFQTEVDIIEEIDEYQTWPGWLILAFRVLIMLWFIYELR